MAASCVQSIDGISDQTPERHDRPHQTFESTSSPILSLLPPSQTSQRAMAWISAERKSMRAQIAAQKPPPKKFVNGRWIHPATPIVLRHPSNLPSTHSNPKRQHQIERKKELLNRVRNGGITKPSQQKSGKKRRRPAKKLVAAEDMDEMRDALPDISDEDEDGEWEGFSEDNGAEDPGSKRKPKRFRGSDGKIKMRSLKHRPGAMKRKRKMEGVEIERFGRNLAQLSANAPSKGEELKEGGGEATEDGGDRESSESTARKEKWAALRAFIGSTMERKGEFVKS